MPTGLVRYQQTGKFHFLTFSCYQRQPFLQHPEPKDIVTGVLELARVEAGLCIFGYVLMPEHAHLITNEPSRGTLSSFLQVFKQRTSRELKVPEQKQFWQRRYYDFNLHSEEKHVEKLRYIHRNPVTRGLVGEAGDYSWSSYRHYATGEPGVVEIESGWTANRRDRALNGIRPTL